MSSIIIEEALYLPEAYSEPPFDILVSGIKKIPEQYLPTVRRLICFIE